MHSNTPTEGYACTPDLICGSLGHRSPLNRIIFDKIQQLGRVPPAQKNFYSYDRYSKTVQHCTERNTVYRLRCTVGVFFR